VFFPYQQKKRFHSFFYTVIARVLKMKGPIEWVVKLPDSVKRTVRVTYHGRLLKWQFKHSNEDKWDYISKPTPDDWDRLLQEFDDRFHRRRVSLEILDHIKQLRKEAAETS
jgi:hypothetical protein